MKGKQRSYRAQERRRAEGQGDRTFRNGTSAASPQHDRTSIPYYLPLVNRYCRGITIDHAGRRCVVVMRQLRSFTPIKRGFRMTDKPCQFRNSYEELGAREQKSQNRILRQSKCQGMRHPVSSCRSATRPSAHQPSSEALRVDQNHRRNPGQYRALLQMHI